MCCFEKAIKGNVRWVEEVVIRKFYVWNWPKSIKECMFEKTDEIQVELVIINYAPQSEKSIGRVAAVSERGNEAWWS